MRAHPNIVRAEFPKGRPTVDALSQYPSQEEPLSSNTPREFEANSPAFTVSYLTDPPLAI